MAIDLFIGGHLFHPAALEWSHRKCSNGCCYCFANINNEERFSSNIASPIKQLYKKDVITHTDLLLKMEHTICISNRTDPFSRENHRDTIALMTHLATKKNSIFFQTKTGPGINEVCDIYGDRKDIVFYITMTTMNPEISKAIEPAAPLPVERLAVARRLHQQGYMVIIALNPLVESWMPSSDINKLVKQLKSIGILHVCAEMLDMSPVRLRKLSAKKRQMLGSQIIKDAETNKNMKNRMYVRNIVDLLIDKGMVVAKKGMPFRTSFFSDVSDQLKVTYPVIQDFVNYCIDKYKSPALVKYSDYESVMARGKIFDIMDDGNSIRSYLLRAGFPSWLENKDKVHSHKDLLRITWNDKRVRTSIQKHCLFRKARKDGKDLLDNDGNIQLYFDGKPYLDGKGVVQL